jgi:tRNA G10  N-methylase Trm11
MIKTKTFVVKGTTPYYGTDAAVAVEKLDDMIKKFIEEKTAEYTSFKVINIQYRPTIESERHWYPSAMLVYDE